MSERGIPEVSSNALGNPLEGGCGWAQGRYVPIREAAIPFLDRGFGQSDATYDVVAVWQGHFFRLEDHIARFFRGCRRLRIDLPFTDQEVREILVELVRRSRLPDAYVSFTATRGLPASLTDRDPRSCVPQFYAYAVPYVWIQTPEQQEVGLSVVVARDTPRIHRTSVDPTVKNRQWGDFTRATFEARDRGAMLPILTSDGWITEAPGANVFVIVGSELLTPARGVFEGITRRTVLECIKPMDDLVASVTDVPVSALYRADEVFMTSTAGGILPVTSLDGQPIGNGLPGPVTRRIHDLYWQLHADPALSFAVPY